jgi:hypothetical protein
MTVEELFDNKIIWLGDDSVCADNFRYFKEELVTILGALMRENDPKKIESSFKSIKNMENEINLDQCLWYVRFFRAGKYNFKISYYTGSEFDLEDARENYHEWIVAGYKTLKWSDLVGDNPTDTYDIFNKINESGFMSESTEEEPFLFRKKIWFDESANREDIERVYQFLVSVGYKDYDKHDKEDFLTELDDFIYRTGLGYFYLTGHRPWPFLDYGSFDDINLNLDEIKEHPNWVYYKDVDTDFDKTSNIFSNLNESIEEPKPKVDDYLYCYKDVIMEDDGFREATAGKFYPIIKVLNRDRLEIINNSKTAHQFSTDPKTDWHYGIWFQLVPKEHKQDFDSFNPEDIFNQLD